MRPPARQHPLPGSVPSSPGTLHPGGQPPTQQQQQGAGLRLWIAPSPDGQHWVRGGGGGGGEHTDLGAKCSNFYSDSLPLSRAVTLGMGCSVPQFPAKCQACLWPLMSSAWSGHESPTCWLAPVLSNSTKVMGVSSPCPRGSASWVPVLQSPLSRSFYHTWHTHTKKTEDAGRPCPLGTSHGT